MHDTVHSQAKPSGRFVLRISPGMHALLRDAAAGAGLSLNDFCARKLAAPGVVEGPAFEVVRRATEQFGKDLLGIVVFGSWARDELTEGSDVDMLVVVEAHVAIVRGLYRSWDERGVEWEGRRVEVHIVHAPEPASLPSGLWAEAALDGLVVFERGFELSRRLAGIRRRIAEGDILRRHAHGRPYWVTAR
jgi:predicted nucleotidyltransferase